MTVVVEGQQFRFGTGAVKRSKLLKALPGAASEASDSATEIPFAREVVELWDSEAPLDILLQEQLLDLVKA